MTETTKTTHEFQASVNQVLSLVINSLYSNKEIFLRELISNASDALDKLRFRAITDADLAKDEARIRLVADAEAGTLTLLDTGVGMSREELEKNLGTVAHSGTKAFLDQIEEAKRADLDQIGQFGVGFYSAYLVADEVQVVSREAGSEEAFSWTSTGQDSFTIEPAERSEHGTSIILHLKDDQKEFLEPHRVRELVRRYSDYVAHPIELEVEREEGEGDEKKTVKVFERINTGSALWRRSASEVEDAQYDEFYTHLTHDWEAPLARKHFKIEGTQLFWGLLFVPKKPPFDLFSPESNHGVRLHVKRVFIMDDAEALLPKWLRFVRGVIDSEDLPLNVSRELLQDSAQVRVIRKQVTKKALDMIEALEKGEDYEAFWSAFGAVLKEGLHFEPELTQRVAKLCRWESSEAEGLVSLEDYVGRMKDEQKAIYYVAGATRAMVENAPHLEGLKKKGYEVLYMTDAIDQWAVEGLKEFDGKPLVSAMDADLKFDDAEDDAEAEEQKKELTSLIERFAKVLDETISEVRISDRLTDSPVCLVLPSSGLPPYMERLMRAQQGDKMPLTKRVMEINPTHPLIANMRSVVEVDADSTDLDGWIEVLHDQALLAEGSPVEDPARLVSRMTSLLADAAKRAAS